ncbi:MAG: DUF4349 domain-containing protein [Terriglobales bacterium]
MSTNAVAVKRPQPKRSALVVLLLVVALILTIVVISIPNLLRSRMAVNQAGKYASMAAQTSEGAGYAGVPKLEVDFRKVLRTGSLDLEVKDPIQTAEALRQLALRMHGYVESSNVWGAQDSLQTAHVTLRIPAERFDEARLEVRKLGVRMQNERVESKDVTGQYVDLESSLRNYRAEEQQYLEIMKRAGAVKDTLEVARQLAEVRGRIERTQGQLKLLSQQVEMATLSVSLRSESMVALGGVRWQPLQRVRIALRDAAQDLADYGDFLILVLFRLPVMLLWVVTLATLAGLGWKLLRWLWRKLFVPSPAMA